MLLNLILSTLLDWFVKFPALWAATGFIVGGIAVAIAAVLVFRKYGAELSKASDKLLDYAKQQLAMMERTLEMENRQHTKALEMQKEHYEAEVEAARTEWKDCRRLLHDKREEWQNESTRMQLVIQELESRPNVTTLNQTMKEVCEQLSQVALDLREHESQTEQRFNKFMEKQGHK